jgi:hypothetical protein
LLFFFGAAISCSLLGRERSSRTGRWLLRRGCWDLGGRRMPTLRGCGNAVLGFPLCRWG